MVSVEDFQVHPIAFLGNIIPQRITQSDVSSISSHETQLRLKSLSFLSSLSTNAPRLNYGGRKNHYLCLHNYLDAGVICFAWVMLLDPQTNTIIKATEKMTAVLIISVRKGNTFPS